MSTKRRTSAIGWLRAPMPITLASLCWRARLAVSSLQTSAARTPLTLLAAICSPLPEPPMTMPSEPGSATARVAAATHGGG